MTGSALQDPPLHKALEIPAAVGHQEDEDPVPGDAVDRAVGLEDHLAELADSQSKQFVRMDFPIPVTGPRRRRLQGGFPAPVRRPPGPRSPARNATISPRSCSAPSVIRKSLHQGRALARRRLRASAKGRVRPSSTSRLPMGPGASAKGQGLLGLLEARHVLEHRLRLTVLGDDHRLPALGDLQQDLGGVGSRGG